MSTHFRMCPSGVSERTAITPHYGRGNLPSPMPAEVYEDSIEFEIGLLEAVIPTTREGFGDSYPYPPLKPLNRVEKRTFRTVVLENAYLRATFVPDLGGRML